MGGEICVNTLKRDWNPAKWSIEHILNVIKCLLIIPFPESSLNDEAGKLFMEDYDEYYRMAKLWTSIHALKSLPKKADVENSPTKFEVKVQKETKMYEKPKFSFGSQREEDEEMKDGFSEPLQSLNRNIKIGNQINQNDVIMRDENEIETSFPSKPSTSSIFSSSAGV